MINSTGFLRMQTKNGNQYYINPSQITKMKDTHDNYSQITFADGETDVFVHKTDEIIEAIENSEFRDDFINNLAPEKSPFKG